MDENLDFVALHFAHDAREDFLTATNRLSAQELIDAARPLRVTCHRAFDMTCDPFEALEDCFEIGFARILTSGQEANALEGSGLIRDLVAKAAGRISIMAGMGLNENTVQEIVSKTAVKEIHFSATAHRDSKMIFRNGKIAAMGEAEVNEYRQRTVDSERVKKIRQLAEGM